MNIAMLLKEFCFAFSEEMKIRHVFPTFRKHCNNDLGTNNLSLFEEVQSSKRESKSESFG
jgi:hypothetical protein